MAYLYILKFQNNGRYYIGSTSDLNRRLKRHRKGHTRTTKARDFMLVFHQDFKELKEARSIGRKIKSWKRKDFIEKIIKGGQIKAV